MIKSVLLVNGDADTRTRVESALAESAPEAAIVGLPDVAAATARPPSPGELLVFRDPTPESLAVATSATGPDGRRRWPAVVVGERWAEEWAEVVPADADVRFLAYALRTAVSKHKLAMECARGRGDLFTIGRRIAHDLRAPLGCILTAGEALVDSPELDSSARTGLVQPIVDSAVELNRLVDRVSFVAKASSATLVRERVNLGDGYLLAVERQGRLIAEKNATLTAPEEWPEIRAVGTWVDMIWESLLLNALQHGGDRPVIEAGWTEEDGGIKCWIRDHGPGVTEAQRIHLFEAFERLHESETAHGLGLPVVRRLVELLGGSYGYEPAPGGGARFHFRLPAARKSRPGS